jgi:endoglucanase
MMIHCWRSSVRRAEESSMLHPPASKASPPVHRPGRLPAAVLIGACLLHAAACTSKESRTATTSDSRDIAGTTGTAGAAGGSPDAGPIVAPQPLSPFIVVDQFGYRPVSEKIAVVRSPKRGFDSGIPFTPGAMYALVDAHTRQKLLEGAPAAWNGGAVDGSSGDLAWWFDFSKMTTPGDYFVLDETQAVRSDVFTISETVYRDVLAQAMRMLYYQRDGFAKDAQHAGAAYVDGAAHMGQCYLYSDASKTPNRDLHGGWWDAGDFNKYTSWGAEDVIELLRAYEDAPAAFRDDYNIPESGNGVPDVLNEVKWELDWLTRMQSADGSVFSIVDEPAARSPKLGGSPDTSPSRVTAPCFYGPATTAASFAIAAAFAYAARIFGSAPRAGAAYPGFADDLTGRARQAWTWARAHSGANAVYFYNSQNTGG